jgi:hypothetical protein
MNCQEFIRLLDGMPLRERTPAQMAAIHQHTHECLSCAQRLLTRSKVECELTRLALVSPSVDLASQVMTRLVRPAPLTAPVPATSGSAGRFWWLIPPIVALVTLAACLYQMGLTTWLKQLVVPWMGPRVAVSSWHLLAVEPGQWLFAPAALVVAIIIFALHGERVLPVGRSHSDRSTS